MSKQNGLLILAVWLLTTASAYAQITDVKANVPFQFSVGKTVLPAGTYFIKSALPPFGGSGMLVIWSSDRHAARQRWLRSISVQSVSAQDDSKLVFRCYGGLCFLSQIWAAGYDVGRQLIKSPREHLLAKEGPALRVLVLAALR